MFQWMYRLLAILLLRSWRVLTMVYNTQDYWVSWTLPSSGILETRKHVSETGSADLNHWIQSLRLALSTGPTWVGVFTPLSPEDGNRSSFRNVVFSSLYNTGRWKSPKNLGLLTVTRKVALLERHTKNSAKIINIGPQGMGESWWVGLLNACPFINPFLF
jgi:hypothetical protein